MKHTVLASLALASVLSMPTAAMAETSYYVGAKGDIASPANSDVKGAATGSVNYGFSSGAGLVAGMQPEALASDIGSARFEMEGSYHALGLDRVLANTNPSGDFKALTLMGNAYYDFKTNSRFTPYVGAGLGQAFVKFPTGQGLGNTDKSDNVLAYQAMAGISYTPEALPQTDISLGYKYVGFESPSFSNGAGGKIKIGSLHENAVEMGVRYHF